MEEERAESDIDLHYCYNYWIEVTYKQRENAEYLKRCIDYCKKDIELYPRIANEMSEVYRPEQIESNSPSLMKYREEHEAIHKQQIENGVDFRVYIPSFERLAIIYEKNGRLAEAISICELAIECNLRASTKGGFTGRLNKLRITLGKIKIG